MPTPLAGDAPTSHIAAADDKVCAFERPHETGHIGGIMGKICIHFEYRVGGELAHGMSHSPDVCRPQAFFVPFQQMHVVITAHQLPNRKPGPVR